MSVGDKIKSEKELCFCGQSISFGLKILGKKFNRNIFLSDNNTKWREKIKKLFIPKGELRKIYKSGGEMAAATQDGTQLGSQLGAPQLYPAGSVTSWQRNYSHLWPVPGLMHTVPPLHSMSPQGTEGASSPIQIHESLVLCVSASGSMMFKRSSFRASNIHMITVWYFFVFERKRKG